MKPILMLTGLSFLLAWGSQSFAYGEKKEEKGKMETGAPAETPLEMPQGKAVKFSASLINPEMEAKKKGATVQVKAPGIDIVDPASKNNVAKLGEGHIHYQVDNGPVIATTATKLSFHNLTPGRHKIVVMIAGNNHEPLGPQQTLWVNVPQS